MATVYLRDSGIMLGLRIWIYNKIRPPPFSWPNSHPFCTWLGSPSSQLCLIARYFYSCTDSAHISVNINIRCGQFCHQKPKHGGHPYCGRTCANEAQTANDNRNASTTAANCEVPLLRYWHHRDNNIHIDVCSVLWQVS